MFGLWKITGKGRSQRRVGIGTDPQLCIPQKKLVPLAFYYANYFTSKLIQSTTSKLVQMQTKGNSLSLSLFSSLVLSNIFFTVWLLLHQFIVLPLFYAFIILSRHITGLSQHITTFPQQHYRFVVIYHDTNGQNEKLNKLNHYIQKINVCIKYQLINNKILKTKYVLHYLKKTNKNKWD